MSGLIRPHTVVDIQPVILIAGSRYCCLETEETVDKYRFMIYEVEIFAFYFIG